MKDDLGPGAENSKENSDLVRRIEDLLTVTYSSDVNIVTKWARRHRMARVYAWNHIRRMINPSGLISLASFLIGVALASQNVEVGKLLNGNSVVIEGFTPLMAVLTAIFLLAIPIVLHARLSFLRFVLKRKVLRYLRESGSGSTTYADIARAMTNLAKKKSPFSRFLDGHWSIVELPAITVTPFTIALVSAILVGLGALLADVRPIIVISSVLLITLLLALFSWTKTLRAGAKSRNNNSD